MWTYVSSRAHSSACMRKTQCSWACADALQAGVVESQPFTDAFFGLYMGTDPVSQDGRSSIARGLASLVAQP